jgi:hypothetical protein
VTRQMRVQQQLHSALNSQQEVIWPFRAQFRCLLGRCHIEKDSGDRRHASRVASLYAAVLDRALNLCKDSPYCRQCCTRLVDMLERPQHVDVVSPPFDCCFSCSTRDQCCDKGAMCQCRPDQGCAPSSAGRVIGSVPSYTHPRPLVKQFEPQPDWETQEHAQESPVAMEQREAHCTKQRLPRSLAGASADMSCRGGAAMGTCLDSVCCSAWFFH